RQGTREPLTRIDRKDSHGDARSHRRNRGSRLAWRRRIGQWIATGTDRRHGAGSLRRQHLHRPPPMRRQISWRFELFRPTANKTRRALASHTSTRLPHEHRSVHLDKLRDTSGFLDMTPSTVPVIIVGAGPTGLSLALLLARSGISSTLVERNKTPQAH